MKTTNLTFTEALAAMERGEKPKPRTNFEKWATVMKIYNIVSDVDFDCNQCPAFSICGDKYHDCLTNFLKWANAPAEEEQCHV